LGHRQLPRPVPLTHDDYDDTRRELLDLEARRKDAKAKDRPRLDAKIDDVRI
jgi:hypothetical protein